MRKSTMETQQDYKMMGMLRQGICNLTASLEIMEDKTSYSYKTLKETLERDTKLYDELDESTSSGKKSSLVAIKSLMNKFPITGDIDKDTEHWEFINNKIEKYELDYKQKGYYGVGSISIPSDIDNITYNYCIDTYKDVYIEVEKQIQNLK